MTKQEARIRIDEWRKANAAGRDPEISLDHLAEIIMRAYADGYSDAFKDAE